MLMILIIVISLTYWGRLKMLIVLIILFVYYITYKLCKVAASADNQELEENLFLETEVVRIIK